MPTLTHNTTSKKYPLLKAITAIGSDKANDIVLSGSGIEPTHATLHFTGQHFVIQTTDRRTELYVNEKKKRKYTLSDGDLIRIGDQELSVSLLGDVAPAASTSVAQEKELEGFQRLKQLSEALLTEYDLPEMLELLMDSVIELTGARKGFLILAEDQGLSIKVARNVNRETVLDADEQVSDSIIEKALKTRRPIIVSDALNDDEFNSSQSVINLNLSSVMCVPLLDRGTLLGIIYVGNDNVASLFTQHHLDLLTTFAGQASLIVANAIMVNDLRLDNEALAQRLHDKKFGSIIGACQAMKQVFRVVEKVAPTSVNVLVLGQTGTGKELIAHEIHSRSPRNKGPFVTINCGAIPETLLESELFGHVKGAFTGATHTKEGKFQSADGGTIFLDEIGEMPLNLQVKLLRVLQERTITKVGATKTEKVDIRIVAATNRDLEQQVEAGEFREDLFYRLNVVMMRLPPLKARGEDVVLIAKYLVQELCEEFGVGKKQLGADAISAMKKYPWPGNIRQLENRLKKAVVLSDSSVLTAEDLDLPPEVLEEIMPLAEAKEHFSYRYIMEALERNEGNRTQTARELGVDPRTIFRYLEKDVEP